MLHRLLVRRRGILVRGAAEVKKHSSEDERLRRLRPIQSEVGGGGGGGETPHRIYINKSQMESCGGEQGGLWEVGHVRDGLLA